MRLEAPFRAAGEHIAVDLPGAHVLFTTRRGGVSTGPYASLNLGLWTEDDPADVSENRDRLAAEVGVPRRRFQQGFQVHASHVRALAEPPDPDAELTPADGQATSVPSVAPVVVVADCLPIAVVAPGAVAMLHAGWRGLHAGVVADGVRAVRELGGSGPVAAAIGPGAGGCCYEVGDEVHAAFAGYGPAVRNGRNVDLKAVARRELEVAGATEVHDVGVCTLCADPGLFFSHRRDGARTGRQAGVAWLL
jgi:YfiH family protein